MSVQIRYATEADKASLGLINALSFESGLLISNVFPGASATSIEKYKSILSLRHLTDPETHVIAAVDPQSTELLGYCRWKIPKDLEYDREVVPLSADGANEILDLSVFAPDPMNKEAYAAFKRVLHEGKAKYLSDRDMVLEFLATAPAHQRKGVGSLCLAWGLEKADALKLRVYVEATPEGLPIYRRLGWEPLEEVSVDYTQFGGQGTQTLMLMMREPH